MKMKQHVNVVRDRICHQRGTLEISQYRTGIAMKILSELGSKQGGTILRAEDQMNEISCECLRHVGRPIPPHAIPIALTGQFFERTLTQGGARNELALGLYPSARFGAEDRSEA